MASARTPMIGIAGWKNSGKTTLVVGLVQALSRRGLRIATIKHAHHDLRPGTTDSERHAAAGASTVAVVSPNGWEISGRPQAPPAPDLEEIAVRLGAADLIFIEGFKSAPVPKIEVRRLASATRRPLAEDDPHVIAIAADHPVQGRGLPVFALDDVEGIAAFIETTIGRLAPRPRALERIGDEAHYFRPEERPQAGQGKRTGRAGPVRHLRRT